MIVVGITGGTGSGKTTVSQIFKDSGIDVIDTDKVARIIVEPQTKALEELCEAFGNEILCKDKTLDRKKVADIVFSDKKKLEILSRITHKYITQYVREYIDNYNGDIIGVDGAVLIGSGIDKICNYILSVISDKNMRMDRIMKRDALTKEEALRRINSQENDEFYIENSDFIVYNNGDERQLIEEVEGIIKKIRSRA